MTTYADIGAARAPERAAFNAIRISLASPEYIRSLSYGEVTKPETINYRTLRPEKDGLFCEKIFGPTKDWECSCGKYKKIRHRGVRCDRCGVEVTRAKVRRERMGHINLASPVAHIWFSKGVPSRLGLLLDLSPRNLERVLYFAQYVVISVDEAVRQRYMAEFHKQLEAIAEADAADNAKVKARAEAEANAAEAAEAASAQAVLAAAEAEEYYDVLGVARGADEAEVRQAFQSLASEFNIDDPEADDPIATKRMTELNEAYDFLLRFHERRAEAEAAMAEAAAAVDEVVAEPAEETASESEASGEDRKKQEEEIQARLDNVEGLRRMQLLTEARFRELRDEFSDLFRASMGAQAILEVLQNIEVNSLKESLEIEVGATSGQRRKKAIQRLRMVESFRNSNNRPEWMIQTVLPVLPPDLRPMVQLDGGRFATSDLNDLYRRVINRNTRLKRLLELGAPEIIVRNEKRMLQEAVDALIDNGRRGRAISGSHNHKLKSLSDLLRGKQGRFRQNLLGKRVDYSGRSVIVVGPELQLHQCGLPKRMALELFKPFVMHKLVTRGYAHNIKSAKRMVERARPEVWDILEEVTKDRPVLLNRAPTLHRLGIQAFMPVLIEGSAIQVHPLVCAAFNADFDGDQMAVHVPLSQMAVQEASNIMLSPFNMLSPSSGDPIVAPTLDIVLGCYYLTMEKPGALGEGAFFHDFDDARLAYDFGQVDHQARISVRDPETDSWIETTVGRALVRDVLPKLLQDDHSLWNRTMDKVAVKDLVSRAYRLIGDEPLAPILDSLKDLGFRYASQSGITIAINDIAVPVEKYAIIEVASAKIDQLDEQFQLGLITEDERYNQAISIWTAASDDVEQIIKERLPEYGGVYLMATSGAKGNIAQIKQMAGMRGLMSNPWGQIIELPVKSSFREGLTVLEYFISTHGARKGLTDTALRTADSGYLTRRLIDVSQDVIILKDDCETEIGTWAEDRSNEPLLASLYDRILGRWTTQAVAHPETGEILAEAHQAMDEDLARLIVDSGVKRVQVRSPLYCEARRGVCAVCYGWSPATRKVVMLNDAVGIVAAQSIGEPGTQLTMRTFHTGGVAQADITTGLPRVEELFEARSPKGKALLSEIDGQVELDEEGQGRRVRISNSEEYREPYTLPKGYSLLVEEGQEVDVGTLLAEPPPPKGKAAQVPALPLEAKTNGIVHVAKGRIDVVTEDRDEREYIIPPAAHLIVENEQRINAGDALTLGPKDPQEILRIQGAEAAQHYLLNEVQKVYRSQGVAINNKHIEIIIRQMLRRVRVDSPGDTELLPGELLERTVYEEVNEQVLAQGGEPATATPTLLGVTRASLQTDSFLAAASFQETTRILTEAAVHGQIDHLRGLKENVIIGRLIPARYDTYEEGRVRLRLDEMELRRERQRLEAEQEARQSYDDFLGFASENGGELDLAMLSGSPFAFTATPAEPSAADLAQDPAPTPEPEEESVSLADVLAGGLEDSEEK